MTEAENRTGKINFLKWLFYGLAALLVIYLFVSMCQRPETSPSVADKSYKNTKDTIKASEAKQQVYADSIEYYKRLANKASETAAFYQSEAQKKALQVERLQSLAAPKIEAIKSYSAQQYAENYKSEVPGFESKIEARGNDVVFKDSANYAISSKLIRGDVAMQQVPVLKDQISDLNLSIFAKDTVINAGDNQIRLLQLTNHALSRDKYVLNKEMELQHKALKRKQNQSTFLKIGIGAAAVLGFVIGNH